MPKLAKSIEVHKGYVYVDGEEFPWYVTDDPVEASVEDGITRVTLVIYTDNFSASPHHRPLTREGLRSSLLSGA